MSFLKCIVIKMIPRVLVCVLHLVREVKDIFRGCESSHRLRFSTLKICGIWMSSLPEPYNTLMSPNSFKMSWTWVYIQCAHFYPRLFKVAHFKWNCKLSVNLNKACHLTPFIGRTVSSLFSYRNPETGKSGIITYIEWV